MEGSDAPAFQVAIITGKGCNTFTNVIDMELSLDFLSILTYTAAAIHLFTQEHYIEQHDKLTYIHSSSGICFALSHTLS